MHDAHIRAYWRNRLSAPAERFRADFADVLTRCRLDLPLRDNGAAVAIFQEGFAEIISLRLQLAFMPIFGILQRIESQLDILAKSGRDRWAPPASRPMMLPMVKTELPQFLREPFK